MFNFERLYLRAPKELEGRVTHFEKLYCSTFICAAVYSQRSPEHKTARDSFQKPIRVMLSNHRLHLQATLAQQASPCDIKMAPVAGVARNPSKTYLNPIEDSY